MKNDNVFYLNDYRDRQYNGEEQVTAFVNEYQSFTYIEFDTNNEGDISEEFMEFWAKLDAEEQNYEIIVDGDDYND